MSLLFWDCETRSLQDIEVRGLDNYVSDPSTSVLLVAYAFDKGPVQLVDLTSPGARLPEEFLAGLNDPFVVKVAWNATFERLVTRKVLGINVPLNEWRDPMVWARHLSMPGKLEKVGPILRLEHVKMREGKDLIRLFCQPCHEGGEETLFGVTEPWFHGRDSHPREWEQFGQYCVEDVETMRESYYRMEAFPLPAQEQALWELDQKINDTGMPVDLDLAVGASKVADTAKAKLTEELKRLSGVENPNSPDQIKAWLKNQGYAFTGIGKPFVTRALAGECPELTDDGRRCLELRRELSKTASNKLVAIRDRVSPDGRLRYQYSFMGAARTGRWSGGGEEGSGGVQLQNLLRPTKEVAKKLENAIKWLKAADYDRIAREFTSALDVVGSCIRSTFAAPPGYHFVVCDLGAIENRGIGYLCNDDSILRVFREGKDPYLDFASTMYHIPYDQMVNASGKCLPEYAEKRQIAKPAVLGAGYRLSGGEERENKDGDLIRTGLWGYAQNMGVEMTQEETRTAVRVFRAKHKKVVQAWYDMEAAAVEATKSGVPRRFNHVVFEGHGKDMLRVILPSGRALHYVEPRLDKTTYTAKNGNEYDKDVVSYMGINGETKQWDRIGTHGGKWLENLTQAFARDVLAEGLILADRAGFEIVGHVHDEIVALVPDGSPLGLAKLRECMTIPPIWAPDLPLAADGYEDKVYRKE